MSSDNTSEQPPGGAYVSEQSVTTGPDSDRYSDRPQQPVNLDRPQQTVSEVEVTHAGERYLVDPSALRPFPDVPDEPPAGDSVRVRPTADADAGEVFTCIGHVWVSAATAGEYAWWEVCERDINRAPVRLYAADDPRIVVLDEAVPLPYEYVDPAIGTRVRVDLVPLAVRDVVQVTAKADNPEALAIAVRMDAAEARMLATAAASGAWSLAAGTRFGDERPNPFGQPRPPSCARCRQPLAGCTCGDGHGPA